MWEQVNRTLIDFVIVSLVALVAIVRGVDGTAAIVEGLRQDRARLKTMFKN